MGCRDKLRKTTGRAAWIGSIVGALLFCSRAHAHENHAPLPTKGVTIAGDTIMLSDKAREAIGLTTAKIVFGDIHRKVTVNARVELPWYTQAMITSLVPGKISHVLVRPGEAVTPGQELARVASSELESLQLALLQAGAEAALARKLADQRSALDQQGVIAGKTLLEAQANLADKSAALEIARQKLQALGLDERDGRKVGAGWPDTGVRVDCQPHRRHHHPRGRAYRSTRQPHGPPLSCGRSVGSLDCGRRFGVRCPLSRQGTTD